MTESQKLAACKLLLPTGTFAQPSCELLQPAAARTHNTHKYNNSNNHGAGDVCVRRPSHPKKRGRARALHADAQGVGFVLAAARRWACVMITRFFSGGGGGRGLGGGWGGRGMRERQFRARVCGAHTFKAKTQSQERTHAVQVWAGKQAQTLVRHPRSKTALF